MTHYPISMAASWFLLFSNWHSNSWTSLACYPVLPPHRQTCQACQQILCSSPSCSAAIMFGTSRHCYWGPSHHRYPVCSIGVYSLSIEVGYGEAGLTWRKCCSNFSCAPGTTTQSTTVRKCADAPCVINKGWLLLCQALLPAACINVQYLFHVQYILVANKLENILLIKLRWNKVLVNQHGGTKCLLKG